MEWTKYKQARYFHKLAHNDLVKLDNNLLFEQYKKCSTKSLVKERESLSQTTHSSAQSHRSKMNINIDRKKIKHNMAELHKNIKKYNTVQAHHSPRLKQSKNHLNATEIIQGAQKECNKSKVNKAIIKKKSFIIPNINHKTNIKRNVTLNNIKAPLASPTNKLKGHKGFTSPKQSVTKERKNKMKIESKVKVEVKRQFPSYNNTRANNLSKVSSGGALKPCVFRTPNASARKINIPKNINTKGNKVMSVRLNQSKQQRSFKSTNNIKPNTILNINELVQRFDEFVWKI